MKLLRKQNVTDTRSVGRSFVRSFGQRENSIPSHRHSLRGYKEDPIKNEGARVFTTLYIDFSDAQGQITLELVVVSSKNWISSKLSCMSSLPTRMKMIHTKSNKLECSQDFSHYKSMGIFPDAQGQLTPQSLVESGPNSNLSEILWLSFLPASMKKIGSKMKALACSQHFAHYNPMGAIRCHGHQSSDPIWPKT